MKTKHLTTVLKFVFVGGLLYFLVRKGFISVEATARAFTRLDKVLPAIALLFFTTFLGIVRWQWLLKAQDIHLSFGRTVQLAMVGLFFNIALPGAVSGDFIKAFYIAREVHGQRARAFSSIFFDRIAGLSALLILGAGALLFGRDQIAGSGFFPAVRVILILPGVAFLAFYTYLFLVSETNDPLLKFLRKMESKVARFGSLTRIYEGVRHYHRYRLTVLMVVLTSILIHFCVCLASGLFLEALGETANPPIAVFIAVPIGLLATAIPIAPAGVGTGHAAFSWLLHFAGTERGADVFSLFALTQFFIGAVGGLVYLRFRAHEPKPEISAETENGTTAALRS